MSMFIKLRQSIKQFFFSLKNQKLTLITTALSTLFGILVICSKNDFLTNDSTFNYLCMTFLCSSAVTLPMNIITKKLKTWLKYLLQIVVTAIFSLIFYLIISKPSDYNTMYYLGILFAVITVTIFLFIPKENSQSYFANLIKNFLFCGLLSLVLFGGIALLIAASDNLIFDFDDADNIYESFALICFIFFNINVFTFYLFEKRSEPSGKGFKIIFLYTLFPIYLVLLAVLYLYLIKALILFKLPQGQLNWFVSFATVFYIVFFFILREYKENKLIRLFYKYGAIILLPLICVQIPAYIIRVNAYGFTGWRYSSLLYTIFATLTIISTFIKKAKYTEYAILVLGAFILFASLSPFNLINSAYNSQYKRMEKILTKYNMLKDNQLNTENFSDIEKQMSDEERKQLYSSFNYLTFKTEHELPEWLKNKKNFKEIFKINDPYNKNTNIIDFKISSPDTDTFINVNGFSKFKNLYTCKYYKNDKILLILSDKTSVDLTYYILALPKEDKYFYYTVNDNITLCIYNVNYRYDKVSKSFNEYSFNYFELIK